MKHNEISKKFKNFTVEIEEVDGRLCAYISQGNYSASWECAMNEGELTNERGWTKPIHIHEYEEIINWLDHQGYYNI